MFFSNTYLDMNNVKHRVKLQAHDTIKSQPKKIILNTKDQLH